MAVLYSGRFFGGGTEAWESTQEWAANHLRFLVRPLGASVFLAASAINWCGSTEEVREAIRSGHIDAAQEALKREVSTAFQNWRDVHATYVASVADVTDAALGEQAMALSRERGAPCGALRVFNTTIQNWRWQLRHLARAEELRRRHGPHDFIIRARLDVTFTKVASLMPAQGLDDRTLLALGPTCSRDTKLVGTTTRNQTGALCMQPVKFQMPCGKRTPRAAAVRSLHRIRLPADYWSDWLYLAREQAFATLVSLAEEDGLLATNLSHSCYGLCQEEQTALQLAARGLALAPLEWFVSLQRVGCTGIRPAIDVPSSDAWTSPCAPRGAWVLNRTSAPKCRDTTFTLGTSSLQ